MPLQTVSAQLPALRAIAVPLLIAAYAALGTMLEPQTWPAAIAVIAPTGVIAIASLYRHQPSDEDESPPTRRGIWVWSVVITAGLLWEAWAFFHQPAWDVANHDYPTLSVLLGPAFEHDAVHFAAWSVWLYAGLRLVRP
jgi:hypothetical protein